MNRNLTKIIPVFLAILLLMSCESDPGIKLPKRKLESVGAIEDRSFQKFWASFREAVLSDDQETLLRLTQFKLEVKGENESDPTVLYSEKEFPMVIHAYLEQMAGPKGKEIEKEIELIQRTTSPYIYRHDFAKVGGMEFTKADGEWKLTVVRLTEGSMKEVNDALNDTEEK